jgi:hypothetical protein
VTAGLLDCVQAHSDEDFRAVGMFRHRCYLADGMIDPRPDQCFLDAYDFAPATQVFMIRSKGRIVGTIRLHVLDKHHHSSATMAAFPDILMPKIRSGMTLLDGARFAIAPEMGALRLLIARKILRLCYDYDKGRDADYGVAAVQDAQIDFYRRSYGFTPLSEPRIYGDLNKRLVLMGLDLRQADAADQTAPLGAIKRAG